MNAIRLFRRYDINDIKNMLETVPEGATHVTDDFRMFINEHFDHLEAIKNQIPVLARISDLKRLVESVDYVGIHGYEKSKEILKNAPVGAECYSWSLGNSGVRDKTVELSKLKQAIADYEQLFGNTETLGGEHV